MPVVLPPEVPAVDGELDLQLREWSVYRTVLRARFVVTEHATGQVPAYAFVTMGDTTLRVRLREGDEQQPAIPLSIDHHGPDVRLAFGLSDGRIVSVPEPADRTLDGDEGTTLFVQFVDTMAKLPAGDVLEIGSRARSGNTYTSIVGEDHRYVGLDIVEGPNVDVVGDAHELEAVFERGRFSAVFSFAVFEHLAMPWKAALSINAVLAPGGLVFVGTHQTFPVHEAPWDFWRYSDRAWHSIFNRATGFEIIGAAMGQPADIVPVASTPSVWGIDNQPGFLTSAVLARKVGEPSVSWPVSLDDLGTSTSYPN